MSDGQIICTERKEEMMKINLKGQRRKQSMRQPYKTMKQIEELSEKRIPSTYNGSATLETLQHQSQFDERNIVEHLRQRVTQLESEISSLHSSYMARIDLLTIQQSEKSEIYLNLIDQIHNRHRLEKENYCKVIAQFQQERSQISSIEQKMNFINFGIEDILRESAEMNNKNKELLQSLEQRDELIREKDQAIKDRDDTIRENQQILDSIDSELKSCRLKVKQYEAVLSEHQQLKDWWASLQQEILGMIDSARDQINSGANNQICAITKNERFQCNHCKLGASERRFDQSMPKVQ